MPSPSHRLARARELESLVRQIAHEVMLPRFLKSTRSIKADGTLFTEADVESQRRFAEELPKLLPGAVLGEEMSDEEQQTLWDNGHTGLWCIDPIDGTTNFANGIPIFAISIAYLVHHKPYIGVVYNPMTGEAFVAADGAGAYLNQQALPLRPPAACLKEAVAGIDFKRLTKTLGHYLLTEPPYFSQRNFGSSALEWCFVAAGRLDVYIHGGQKLWDFAAGSLILAETRGKSMALDGEPLMNGPSQKRAVIAAANGELFDAWRRWIEAHMA